jgi:hypothetical protein
MREAEIALLPSFRPFQCHSGQAGALCSFSLSLMTIDSAAAWAGIEACTYVCLFVSWTGGGLAEHVEQAEKAEKAI